MSPWTPFGPRQLTGRPHAYHAYVGRGRPERACCPRDHRKPETARACAEREAGRRNAPPRPTTDYGRLYGYAERRFQRSGRTQFPTVREAARALGWRQSKVLEVAESGAGWKDPGEIMLTMYRGTDDIPAEHFVETLPNERRDTA